MFETKEILSRLADYFNKDPSSNIGKLITIFSEQLKAVEDNNKRIREWRDIDKAEGYGLDVIGDELNQPRGVATDEIYRVLLKSKNARNLSTGDINTIIQVLAIALDTDYSDIRIKEGWADPNDPQPATLSVIELPIKRLNEVGMDPTQFARIIQKTVAAGIRVNVIELAGTFEFGGLPITNDPAKGFSDELGEVGGYLGTLFSPSTNQDLPI